jgi:GNAT superfamily N-acetyltransferase
MQNSIVVRSANQDDYPSWRSLWDGYNAFYHREGATALAEEITRQTWARIHDKHEPVDALVAEHEGKMVGIAHIVIHRSTTRLADVCYLQDLFTSPAARGQGVARALIEAVYLHAQTKGGCRVYWQTHETNHIARTLYDHVAQHKGFIVYSHELPARQ